jgi:hypothetical protein
MFFINTYQWEWTTSLALHAPKPLLFANSDNDRIFPMDGNRRVIARLRQAYEMLGAKENVDEHVSKGGHDYRPDLRVAVFGFFNKHLKGDGGPVKDADFPMIEGKELRVFPEDKDLPKDQINDWADEVFVPAAEVKPPPSPAAFPVWKADLTKRLKERSFRTWEGRPDRAGWYDDWVGNTRGYRTEADIVATLFRLKQIKEMPAAPATLIVLNRDEDPRDAEKFWAGVTAGDFLTEAYAPRGVGPGRWSRKNPPNTTERSLALVGQTVDAGRVRDVVALIDFHFGVRARKGQTVRLVGRGEAGIIAAYAALLWGKPVEVIVADPPASHRDGPHFLGVQRVLDVPDALGLLAPDVKLTLIGAKDPAFDKTAAIYKLAGAEAKFERK